MIHSRPNQSRRRFLAVSSLGLTAAAFVSRGLNVRREHQNLISETSLEQQPPLAQLTPEQPASEINLPEEEQTILTEPESYAEFITSLNLRHITAREVIEPHWSDVNGVSNELPPRELWDMLPPTLRVADEIRARLGVPLLKITSAYRSPRYNSQIAGSAKNSFHTKNQALDLVFGCASWRVEEVAGQLRNEGLFKGGIGRYSTFIHIDTRGHNATWRKG